METPIVLLKPHGRRPFQEEHAGVIALVVQAHGATPEITVNQLCYLRSTCSGQECPIGEPECVEKCTCYDPPSSPEKNVGSVVASEGMSVILHCEELEKTINITKATYGRNEPGNVLCPHPEIHTTNCSTDTTNKVNELCSGKRACQPKADHTNFGDPCVGTYKYLKVSFNCI